MKELEQRGFTHIAHLAAGGEGNVYTCEKEGEKYIAKVIAVLDSEQLDILKSINALRSEYFPKIIEILNNENQTIIIREYVKGTTLADEIKKNNYYSVQRAKEIIFEVCNALRALHTMKPNPVIYRDLKPENIIITPAGKAKLIDFGIARYYKQESVRDTVLAGTKGYTAPEVMAGMQSDERSDIYSVGLLLYELLSGRSLQDPPYQIRPVAENNEYLPDYIDEIIAKATDIDQTKRYASIGEFVYVLENIKEIKAKQKKKNRRRRLYIALAVVVLLAAAVILVLPLLKQPTPETILDLQFDDAKDAGWLDICGKNAENINPQECIEDGVFRLQQEAVLKYTLEAGQLFHIRIQAPKISEDGSMYMIDLTGVNSLWEQSDSQLGFRFYVNNNMPYILEPHLPNEYSHLALNDSAMLARAGEQVDVIIWLNDKDHSIRYIVSDPGSREDITYTGVTLDDAYISNGWQIALVVDTGMGNGVYSGSDLQTEIEFIRVSSGPIKAYLAENIPAYTVRKERVDAFLEEVLPMISELEYMPYG